MEKLYQRALAHLLSEKQQNLYAIVDCASSQSLHKFLQENIKTKICLYSGISGVTLAEVAPYLIAYRESDAPGWHELFRIHWGKSSLIALHSSENIENLKNHLKKLTMVEVEIASKTYRSAYFRYYDPRVWLDFIQVATNEQLSLIFGKMITAIHSEHPSQPSKLVTISREQADWLAQLLGTVKIDVRAVELQ